MFCISARKKRLLTLTLEGKVYKKSSRQAQKTSFGAFLGYIPRSAICTTVYSLTRTKLVWDLLSSSMHAWFFWHWSLCSSSNWIIHFWPKISSDKKLINGLKSRKLDVQKLAGFFKIKFRNVFAPVWECKLRLLVPEFIKEERAEV